MIFPIAGAAEIILALIRDAERLSGHVVGLARAAREGRVLNTVTDSIPAPARACDDWARRGDMVDRKRNNAVV